MTERLSDKNPCNDCRLYNPCTGPCDRWHEWNSGVLSKLAEYETAEKQGRLVVLPCKLGTPVYFLRHGFDGWRIDSRKFAYGMIGEVGKTVFLTREEAEKALEEMEKDE